MQSVTNQMAVFTMQHSILPAGVRHQLEKIQRDFIWKSESGKRKLHAVSWETLCKEKKNGGFGLKSLKAINDLFKSN